MLTRQKIQCFVLGRCAILVGKFRKCHAGPSNGAGCVGQCLDIVGVFRGAEHTHNDCNNCGGMYISGFIIAASESGVRVVVKTKLIEHSK